LVTHTEIILSPREKGFHLITDELLSRLPTLHGSGLLHLFIKHTSAGICINENSDSDVLHDFNLFFDRLAPERLSGIRHKDEGPDDMPAHIKAVICGHSVSLPFSEGELRLGIWQGIYLGEFRIYAPPRKIIASIIN
jgi:secondary thiamine-phosphate synthase enzyme